MSLWPSFINPRKETRDVQHGSKKRKCSHCDLPLHDHDRRQVEAEADRGPGRVLGYFCPDTDRRADVRSVGR